MCLPGHQYVLVGIIVAEVMARHLRVHAFGQITLILLFERVGVVLAVTQHKDLTAVHCLYDVHTGFVRLRENGQTIIFADVGGTHLGVARVRCAEDIIEAAQQRLLRQQNMVLENTGHFLGQHVLQNTVVIIQTGLRTPADVQRGMNVRF